MKIETFYPGADTVTSPNENLVLFNSISLSIKVFDDEFTVIDIAYYVNY